MQLGELIFRAKLFAFKVVLRTVDLVQAHGLLVASFDRFIVGIDHDGVLKNVRRSDRSDIPTILFLNHPHYPAVAKTLAAREDLNCLAISQGLLKFLLAAFVHEYTTHEKAVLARRYDSTENNNLKPYGIRHDFRMAEPGSRIDKGRRNYQAFLRKILPSFLERHGIDLVFNSDARYRREADFSRVASELGYPHICMPRDSMFIVPSMFANSVRRHKNLGTFHGDQLFVQNEATRQVFLQSGHAQEDQVSVLGSIKMDDFIQHLNSGAKFLPARKMVLMFTWPLDRRTQDHTVIDLHGPAKDTIRAMTRLALQRPDVDFVVKMKGIHIQTGQRSSLQEVVSTIEGVSNGLENLKFYGDEKSSSDLILSASVICAMQSTTVLEAAASRKPVILPHFKTLRDTPSADEVLMFGDCRELFDVPDTEDDMVELIEQRLEDANIPDAIHQARLDLFERHIAPLSGDGTERCVNLLKEYALKGRQKRNGDLAHQATNASIHETG